MRFTEQGFWPHRVGGGNRGQGQRDSGTLPCHCSSLWVDAFITVGSAGWWSPGVVLRVGLTRTCLWLCRAWPQVVVLSSHSSSQHPLDSAGVLCALCWGGTLGRRTHPCSPGTWCYVSIVETQNTGKKNQKIKSKSSYHPAIVCT